MLNKRLQTITLRLPLLYALGVATLLLAQPTQAQTEREEAADRYLEVFSFEQTFSDAVEAVIQQLPPEEREASRELIEEHVDVAALREFTRGALIEHYTAQEMNALADFFSGDVGQSILEKQGPYMADVMSEVRRQILDALSG